MPLIWTDDDDIVIPGLESVRTTENPTPAEPEPAVDFTLTGEPTAPAQLAFTLSIRATFGRKDTP